MKKDINVLVVEDDPELAEQIERILRKGGYQAVRAHQVSESAFKARNQKFDCILLDVRLKGGSGETILSKIRSDGHDPNHETPVVIVSGQLDTALVERVRSRVQGFLVKPFDSAALLEKVRQALTFSGQKFGT